MNIKVSVIIPVYKVEPYIVRCIESVLHQTYRNLEVILVDDCSPDRSMELAKDCIAQSPLSKDLYFIYLMHDHNRGLSAARNTGIDAAKGDYIYFLDSDDEMTNDCIESLSKHVDGYQIVQGDYLNSNELQKNFKKDNFALKSNEEILNAYSKWKIRQTAWNKLLLKDFIITNKLYFREGLINEDDLWSFQLYYYAQSCYYCACCTYKYTVRPHSIMTSMDMRNFIDNLVYIYGLKIDFCIEKGIYNDLIEQVLRGFVFWIFEWNDKEHSYKRRQLYSMLRKKDRRSFMQRWRALRNNKNRIRYFYELFPSFLSYFAFAIKLRAMGTNQPQKTVTISQSYEVPSI